MVSEQCAHIIANTLVLPPGGMQTNGSWCRSLQFYAKVLKDTLYRAKIYEPHSACLPGHLSGACTFVDKLIAHALSVHSLIYYVYKVVL